MNNVDERGAMRALGRAVTTLMCDPDEHQLAIAYFKQVAVALMYEMMYPEQIKKCGRDILKYVPRGLVEGPPSEVRGVLDLFHHMYDPHTRLRTNVDMIELAIMYLEEPTK